MNRKLSICSLFLAITCTGVFFINITGCKKTCCTIGYVLSTDTVSEITNSTARCGGMIASDDEDSVTARGVCWSARQSPTIDDDTTADGIGTGVFKSFMTDLASNTIYYVRAYVTNKKGTAYGNQQVFTTLAAPVGPVIQTLQISGITQTTVTSGGTITSAGVSPVTARGVCWGTLHNPTTADSTTSDGSGTGRFISNLTGLTAGTIYYLRAYATNSYLTSYGNEVTFTTNVNDSHYPGMPTFTSMPLE